MEQKHDDPAKPEKELEEVKAELEKARASAQEHLDGWKRAKADYLNLKRDTEKGHIEMAAFATGTVILELLPSVDALERAVAQLPEERKNDEWTKGIIAIHRELQGFLHKLGIEKVKTDVPFTPEWHEAIAREERPGVAAGTILEVATPGYLIHGKLLRPAKVKVAK